MGDNGVVHGVIQSDPSRPRSYNVNFFAFNTLNWQRNMTVLRLELRFTVNENVRDNHHVRDDRHGNDERQAARRADSLVHKAFQAYSRWVSGRHFMIQPGWGWGFKFIEICLTPIGVV